PLSGDFTIFGGLYSGVHLLALDPLHISPLDDASPGVYLKQVHVDDSSAEVERTTKLRNDADLPKVADVECTMITADGIVAVAESRQQIAAHTSADVIARTTVKNPHLWNGRSDPYLYRALVLVSEGKRVTDRVEQPLGLRYFHIDPELGVTLNGKP